MTNIRTEIANLIRRVDGDNTLPAHTLGVHVAETLSVRPFRRDSAEVIAFVKHFNRDKTLSAGALADAIVDKFNLDEEN